MHCFLVGQIRQLPLLFSKQAASPGPETSKRKREEDQEEARETKVVKGKPAMAVNEQIFNELPKSVQEELAQGYELTFLQSSEQQGENQAQQQQQQTPNEPDKSPSPLISQPILPPWSQLDPESLLALPDAMREQVLKAYSAQPKPPRRPEVKQPSVRAPTPTPSSPKGGRLQQQTRPKRKPASKEKTITLTQMFAPHRPVVAKKNDQEEEEDFPWDVNIWNELPLGTATRTIYIKLL